MYHPVLKDSYEERHEFVEIENRGDKTHDLEGLKVRGIGFTFGSYELKEGESVIVAKDPDALLDNPHYDLDPDKVVGGYPGTLSNNGETLSLESENEIQVDEVTYSAGFPWPIAPDALGVNESWLPAEMLPLTDHQHGGVSLERVSCAHPSTDPANWEASPLDGASPGAENSAARSAPLPVVTSVRASKAVGSGHLEQSDPVLVTVGVTGSIGAAQLEYFVDDPSIEGETTELIDLEGSTSLKANLDGFPENTIVRYRIVGDRGEGEEIISPRPSDPYEWHSFFVNPEIEGTTRPYHLFISPQNWSELWNNVERGRADGCDVNEDWQSRVPATFVYDGRTYDVQVRYQGSRWNRAEGPSLSGFSGATPSAPSPLRGLSWRIGFPRYDKFEGRSVMILNKLEQGCPGFTAIAGFQLFRDHDLPAPLTGYRRLFINGAYYRYMMELHRIDGDLMERYHAETGGGEVGHLFKASGLNGDEGPWGWGNGRLLEENCGYTPAERYEYTYKRKTHDWDETPRVQELIEGLHQARDESDEALRAYLELHFDVDKMLTHLAVMSTIGPWDDIFHNYALYQRLEDEKWMFVPWDLDLTFGGMLDSRGSLFVGEEGNSDNALGWNVFKDAFLQTHREEFVIRIKSLGRSTLSTTRIQNLIDDAYDQAVIEEAEAAPGGVSCSYDSARDEMLEFIEERTEFIADYSE